MNRPSISKLTIAEKRKKEIFRVIHEALISLRFEDYLPVREDDISRRLFFCFNKAIRKYKFNYLPVYQGKNPPDPEDSTNVPREDKVPDFYWQIPDHTQPEDIFSWQFVVECKRLGKPSSSSWIFNKNYVDKGIQRFVDPIHGYGKGDDSGAMIGYVQSMYFDTILTQVNDAASQNSYNIPILISCCNKWQDISIFEHHLTRSFNISPYLLTHLWVDIRKKD